MQTRPSLFVILSVLVALALAPASALAKKKTVEATPTGPAVLADVNEAMPYKSFEAFKTAADTAMANTEDPSALVTLFVQAMVARTLDEKLGEGMMGYIVAGNYRMAAAGSESGFTINKIFKEELAETDRKPRILTAYCGGTPSGNYRDHDFNNCIPVIDSQYSARMQGPKNGRAKYYVTNNGASRPRPITLKEEEGIWRVYTVSGLMTGVFLSAEEAEAKNKK